MVIFVSLYSSISLIFILILSSPNPGVYFLDVGQGDSILIISKAGNRILVDAGNVDGKSVKELTKIFPWFDRRIDLAIGTHADQDHVGGFTKLVQDFSINKFLFSHLHTTKDVEKNLFEALNRAKVSTSTINRGAKISFGDDHINIFYPARSMKMTSDKDTNLFSIVATACVGTTTFLLTGDAPESVELKLLKDNIQAEVLKVGHHGSKNSSDPVFISKVNPTYAIISAGKNNRYGHPHIDTMRTLESSKIRILKTYESGTLKF